MARARRSAFTSALAVLALLTAVVLLRRCEADRFHDPRRHPTRLEQARYTVADVAAGRVEVVQAASGESLLVALRNGQHWGERVDVLSALDGTLQRTVWRLSGDDERVRELEALPSVHGCASFDIALAITCRDAPWRVEIVCGDTGARLRTWSGESVDAEHVSSLASLGDLDGDGAPEVAYGVRRWRRSDESSSSRSWISLRSGADGRELRRVETNAFGPHLEAAPSATVRGLGDLDGDGELEWCAQFRSGERADLVVYSGLATKPGRVVASRLGDIGSVGDLDGDGHSDLFLDRHSPEYAKRFESVQLASGRTLAPLFELSYPDMWSELGVTAPMGDLDGDGVPEIALGEPNYGLRSVADGGQWIGAIAHGVASIDLAALARSDPRSMGCESGCALIYSGRTRQLIWGAWAPPDSGQGLGYAILPLPDVTGDGFPDVLVCDGDTAYALPGPGRAR